MPPTYKSLQTNTNSARDALSLTQIPKASFTLTVNITVSVNDTFDLFDILGKQNHKAALNTFLNCMKKLGHWPYV